MLHRQQSHRVGVSIMVDGHVIAARPLNLEDLDDAQVEALARELEQTARHLRDGWRGRATVVH